MLTRARKTEIVDDLKRSMSAATAVIAVSPKELNTQDFDQFRNSVRESGGSVQMVKNTLLSCAVKGTDLEPLFSQLKGTTVLTMGTDMLSIAKAWKSFDKKFAGLLLYKAGVSDGENVPKEMLVALADLPSKDELRAELVGVLAAPASRIVRVLTGAQSAMLNVFRNKIDKGE